MWNFGAYIGKGHTYDLQHSAAGVVPHRVSTRVMVGVHVFLIAYIWIIQNMVVWGIAEHNSKPCYYMLILKLYNFQSTAIKTVSRWRAWKYYTAVATCQSDKTEVVSLVAIQDFLPSTRLNVIMTLFFKNSLEVSPKRPTCSRLVHKKRPIIV